MNPGEQPAGLTHSVARVDATTLSITFGGTATGYTGGETATGISFTIDGSKILFLGSTPLTRDLTTENFTIEFMLAG